MPRESGKTGVGEAFMPPRPRYPFALANEGKPFARNDLVLAAAFAAHRHGLFPGIVGIDNVI